MFSIVKSLKEKLSKSRNSLIGKIAETLSLKPKIDEDLLDELTDILLQADVGPDLSVRIIDELRDNISKNNIKDPSDVQKILFDIIHSRLLNDYENQNSFFDDLPADPFVVLVIGVNGTGKTTTIGKLANNFVHRGKSVLLIAADTFRAAAVEQLTIWAERANITVFKKESGTDPSSVIYDGLSFAHTKKINVVIIDTAGRQHNKVNLMNELGKINRTIKKVIKDAPHETLIVLDASTGQNALSQAHFFNEVTPLSGVVLTKLDGTAKGGIVIAVKHQLNIPVKLIGIGENIEDLREFDANQFVEAMFNN